MRLNPQPASRIIEGEVIFQGIDLLKLSEDEMRGYRGKHLSMVLQDTVAALNPVFTIGEQLYETLRLHVSLRGHTLKQRAADLLRMLRVPSPETRLHSYPHQFSGGMRQRSVGAIALSSTPDILIADEPTTALDATTQAAYLQLLKEIQHQTDLSIIFVTHDLAVVARMCDRMAVMYGGKIVETGDTETIFHNPAHPYTEALLKSVPDVRRRPDRLYSIEGQPPSIYRIGAGCPFAPRCSHADERCRHEFPAATVMTARHSVSCWRYLS
jgi:oligopeptide/dipeptide ABC transporter ATP-binding protein